MRTERYEEQVRRWPPRGRHILAQYDEQSICVYQAFRPSIAAFARASLRRFATETVLSIEDITPFVHEQRARLEANPEALIVPEESVYLPTDPLAAASVGIDPWP